MLIDKFSIKKHLLLLGVFVLFNLFFSVNSLAADSDASELKTSTVKAALVNHLLRYTQWPSDKKVEDPEKFYFGVVGTRLFRKIPNQNTRR